jgi:hypothetical protein
MRIASHGNTPKVLINRADIKSAGVLHFVSELRIAPPAPKKH